MTAVYRGSVNCWVAAEGTVEAAVTSQTLVEGKREARLKRWPVRAEIAVFNDDLRTRIVRWVIEPNGTITPMRRRRRTVR